LPSLAGSPRARPERASAFAAAGGLGLHRRLSIAAAANAAGPLAPCPGHFPVTARHLIVFFMTGGFSHLDTFDYKPKLQKDQKLQHPLEFLGH
jgi:Protein of unknown function (DUF1501)